MGEGLLRKDEIREERNLPPNLPLKRLLHKEEVKKVFSSGRKVISDSFILYFLRNSAGRSRYAIHARKKLGMAVERNRVKRIFRAALYQLRDLLYGYDIIIIPRKKVKDLDFHLAVHKLEQIFFETGLSKKR